MKGREKISDQYSLFFIQRFKGKVLFGVPMSEHTSYRIGGPADVMAFPQDESDLKDLLGFADSKGFPYLVIGNGTNLLVRDGGIRGIVINMSEGFKDIAWHDDLSATVGAGVGLGELVSQCKDRGASGLEFAVGIPGSVGGAVCMNAGAYGNEIKDVVEGVEVMAKKGQKTYLSNDEIGFSYRSSNIPKNATITRARMRFEKKDPKEIAEAIKNYRDKRKASAQISLPSAGSVFKNPEGTFAGRLIEEAGLKGERSGDAQISEAHANYIVNLGKAKAKDVLNLMALVRDRVYSSRGIVLEPEIKVVGED